MTYDYCVIGGGIIGLATAMQLLERRPGASVIVLEKELELAHHQTGHNSGVIHSGIYYAPGSLKAQMCRDGASATKRFAAEHGIAVNTCGKLLVATSAPELLLMNSLHRRAEASGISVEPLSGVELSRREPAVRGLGALYVGETGIVDYVALARAMAAVIRRTGGLIETGATVTRIVESGDSVRVESGQSGWTARRLAVCAGLQADRIARLAGIDIDFQIVPFRGEYYRLPANRNNLIQHLIYPIPTPELPFLGIHLTRTIDGGVTVGPNAVLGMAREGYERRSFNAHDVAEYARFPGMWRMARKYFTTGAREIRNSFFKRGYLAECRRYCPELTIDDLQPEPAGIRAQAVMRNGTLVHDFLFVATDRTLHVCNAPSPAATSAIPIARHITDRLLA